MNFQERMAWAVEQNKHRQTTQRQAPVTRTATKKTPTPDEYRTATLQRVLTKMKINKEQA